MCTFRVLVITTMTQGNVIKLLCSSSVPTFHFLTSPLHKQSLPNREKYYIKLPHIPNRYIHVGSQRSIENMNWFMLPLRGGGLGLF